MRTLMTFLLMALAPGAALAATGANSGDTAWILTSTALVLFMTLPGLALFYGGLVRTRNVLSILVQCFAITGIVTILWLLFGYSWAFGGAGTFFGGFGKALFAGVTEGAVSGSIPESLFAAYQLTFAIITPALVIGAFAERMKFGAVVLFTILWSVLVYFPVAHWVWGGGWLQARGFMDFAGGTVVHVTAGMAALVAALIIGKRKGFPDSPMPPHNMTMVMTGAGMLWVGWFGFNGGSALAANGDAAMALLATHIAAAAGAMTWMTIEWLKFGKPSALGIATGMVAGLGTITPASGFVGPAGALVIGIVAGIVCFNMVTLMKNKLGVDDSLDVFPVHGVGGFTGTLLTGIFAATSLGIFGGQGFSVAGNGIGAQLGIQALGDLSIAAYTLVFSFIIFLLIDKTIGLRVPEEVEVGGLDLAEHGEHGYDL